jgi:hypothetical protein
VSLLIVPCAIQFLLIYPLLMAPLLMVSCKAAAGGMVLGFIE